MTTTAPHVSSNDMLDGLFVEILSPAEQEQLTVPTATFRDCWVVHVPPAVCGPLVQHLARTTAAPSTALSHLRRVRRRQHDGDKNRPNTQKALTLHVFLGAVDDLADTTLVADVCRTFHLDAAQDATIEALPARMAESTQELQTFDQIWPTVYLPQRTVAHQRAARRLAPHVGQHLVRGMEMAAAQGDQDDTKGRGVVILDPQTGQIWGRACEEQRRQQQQGEASSLLRHGQGLGDVNPLATPILWAIQAVSREERVRACQLGINDEKFATGQYLCTGLACCTVHEPTAYEAMALVHARIHMVVFGVPNNADSETCHGGGGLTRHYIHNLPDTNHRFRAFQCRPDTKLGELCRVSTGNTPPSTAVASGTGSSTVPSPTTRQNAACECSAAIETFPTPSTGQDGSEDAQRRDDEWQALMAMYEADPDVSLETSGDQQQRWTIHVGRARLQMQLPVTYPSRDPPSDVSVYAPHVSEERLHQMEAELHDLWTPDCEVVLLWAEHVRSALEELETSRKDSASPLSSGVGRAAEEVRTEEPVGTEHRPWPTTRLPWNALVEIIQVNQDVPQLRRSQADEQTYKKAMTEIRSHYGSVTDYILATKFHLPTETSADDGKQRVLLETRRTVEKRLVLVPNDFPYFFETNIEHWILWKIGGTSAISRAEIQQAMDDLKIQLGNVKEFLHWVNPPSLKSIPDLDHVHILCLRGDTGGAVLSGHGKPPATYDGTLQFVPPSAKYGQPIRTFPRAVIMNDQYRRKIFRGDPFHPPKSGPSETMIAFCASVESIQHVQWVWAELLFNEPKVAKASHNMVAYRFRQNHVLASDNDDDGEKGAGAKLASLLELADAQNVMVLVARWYGGVHLGPARFKWIASTARAVLEQSGFVHTK